MARMARMPRMARWLADNPDPKLKHGLSLAKLYLSYRSSINHPGRLPYQIFGPREWLLIQGGRLFKAGHLLNFPHFQYYYYY